MIFIDHAHALTKHATCGNGISYPLTTDNTNNSFKHNRKFIGYEGPFSYPISKEGNGFESMDMALYDHARLLHCRIHLVRY